MQCASGTLSYIQTRCQQALDNLEMRNVEGSDEVEPCLKSTSADVIASTEDIHSEVSKQGFEIRGSTAPRKNNG